jgi:hypothetical protein
MVCAKHKATPVKIYKQCVGCEIEGYRDENTALRSRLAEVEAQRDGLREIVQNLIDEDPNEQVTEGGGTVLDLWRHDAREALTKLEAPDGITKPTT